LFFFFAISDIFMQTEPCAACIAILLL
jgi:hypothetical protein